MPGVFRKILDVIPGILLAAAIAVPSIWFHRNVCNPVSALAAAIVVGIVIGNTFHIPESCKPGIKFSVKTILRAAIIILGVRLSFGDVVKIGGASLGIILTCIVVAIALVQYISAKMGLPGRLGTLIGVGTAICGNSAVIATAPVIDAKDEEIAFAVATVTLFGVLAIFGYPFAGKLLHLTETRFGTWAGTAINDTSQVVTAAFIYGNTAGEVATVVKLTRTLFVAPLVVILGYIHAVRLSGKGEGGKKARWTEVFPWFVLGFVAMSGARSIGILPGKGVETLKELSDFLIVVAIAGVGLTTNFRSMLKTGLKPFYAGLTAAVIMGAVSLALITVLRIG